MNGYRPLLPSGPTQSLVGAIGTVITPVRGGEKPGEVRVVVRGVPHVYFGYAPMRLEVGTGVVVINNRGHLKVDVERWPEEPDSQVEV